MPYPIRMLTAFGQTKSVDDWVASSGVSKRKILRRLLSGRSSEYAVTDHKRERESYPGANDLAYEEDLTCQVLVNGKQGMTYAEIGVVLGCSEERARSICEEGMVKVHDTARAMGLVEPLREWLRLATEIRQERDDDYPPSHREPSEDERRRARDDEEKERKR